MFISELTQFLKPLLHANSSRVCVYFGRVKNERMKYVKDLLFKGEFKYTQCILKLFAYKLL